MTRKIGISLVFSMILTACVALTGCGKSDKIEVKIGMWPDPTLTQDVAMFEKWEQAFEADHPEYDIIAAPYQYAPNTAQAMGLSSQLPTVFQTWLTEPQKLIDNGFIADITDQLKELGWYDKMDPDMREAVSKDGRVYGVPRDGYGMGLFLNLAMLYDVGEIEKNDDGTYRLHDEAGNPLYPTTFDDLERIARKIQESYSDTYGLVILSADRQGGWQFSNLAWNFGAKNLQIVNSDGTVTANLNDEGAVKALEWIKHMRSEGLVFPQASLKYADWYAKIGSGNVAMAFCGSDALALPVTTYNFNIDDIAFVPMPTGDGTSRYSLYGGVPYVFASNATDEQIKGALMFLEYMGRSPETSDISKSALELGHQTAQIKGMPILPTIKAWVDEDYLALAEGLEQQYVNVNMNYYEDFFDTIQQYKKSEEPYYCQDMYDLYDSAIQQVLSSSYADADCKELLTTANNTFQNNFLSKMKSEQEE